MLSLLVNNLHVKLYSGVSIGVINRLESVIDFNVSSTLSPRDVSLSLKIVPPGGGNVVVPCTLSFAANLMHVGSQRAL